MTLTKLTEKDKNLRFSTQITVTLSKLTAQEQKSSLLDGIHDDNTDKNSGQREKCALSGNYITEWIGRLIRRWKKVLEAVDPPLDSVLLFVFALKA